MKTIKHSVPFVKAAKLFEIPIQYFFALSKNDLKEIPDMKINDEIELIVNFNNMLENVEDHNKNIMMMLDNSDPDIKEINYKLITTAGEIYKNLLSEIDNEYNGIDIRDISFR